MRKLLLFILFCLYPGLISLADNTNQPTSYIGVVSNQYESFFQKMVQFSISEGKQSLAAIGSPSDGNALKWGTWAEDRYVGAWRAGSEEEGTFYLYKSFDPISKEWKIIGEGDGKITFAFGRDLYDAAYDNITKKIYVIAQSKLYSNDLTNTTFTEVGTINDGLKPSALAFNKAGQLYAVCQEGGPGYTASAAKLYKIDKTTAAATLVGDMGIKISYYDQAAVFDYNTDVLYLHCAAEYSDTSKKTYTVNITTGVATEITSMQGVAIAGMASMYYTKNVPPGRVADLALAIDGADNNKFNLSFTVPETDINGNASLSAAKVKIYKKNASGGYDLIETVDPATPGNRVTKQYVVAGEGKYTYAVEVLTATDRTSGMVTADISNIQPIALPYENDFSTHKPNVVVTITEEGNIFYSSDKGVDASPCYGIKKGAKDNRLDFTSIPVRKGATYCFAFDALTEARWGASFCYDIDGVATSITINKDADDKYVRYQYYYIAKEDKEEIIFSLYKSSATDTDITYIDNVSIKEVSLPTAPGKTSLLGVTAAPLGAMKALVNVKTPDKDMLGNSLTKLTGIKVEYASSFYTMKNYGTAEVAVTEMGAERVLEIPITTPAESYYFRVSAYNADGYCYDITESTTGVWIGEDSRPATPVNLLLTSVEDNKLRFEWAPVTVGRNGGYVDKDEITYSVTYFGGNIPSADPTIVYDIVDTCFITPAIPLGAYEFKVKAHHKTTVGYDSTKVQTLNSDSDDQQIVADAASTAYSYQDYPFSSYNYSATDVSGLSQMTYTAEELGGAMYIDQLHFFITNSYSSRDVKLAYEVALGYKENESFEDDKDFVSRDQLQTVFNDSIHFEKTTNAVTIPIKGFYYDGKQPLVIQLIKTFSGKAEIDTYVSTKTSNRVIRSKSLTEAVGEIADPDDYPGVNRYMAVPSLVVTKNTELSTISGTVSSEETGLSMEGVLVTIASVAGENEKPLHVEVLTDANGEYRFETLPFNSYEVTVSASGYVDSKHSFTLDAVEDKVLDVVLEGANKINVKGKVINLNNDVLEDVLVVLSRTDEVGRTSTAADGTFEFDVYGSTQYTVSLSKEGMVTQNNTIEVESEDSTLEPFTLRYQVVAVPSVSVSLNNDGQGVVSWEASSPAPANGYRVYRGTADQTFEQYTELTSGVISETTFTDKSLSSIEYGMFKYAVSTDWYGEDLSTPVYSSVLDKNMTLDITVNVKTNGASAEGAALTLSNTENTYNAVADATGKAQLTAVRRGTYTLNITLDYHKAVNMPNLVINSSDAIESSELEELVAQPVIGETSSVENLIEINWTISNTVNPTGYEVYLDNVLKETLAASVLTYTYRNVEAGNRVVGIKAVFASGETEMVTKSIAVEGLPKPIYLNAVVDEKQVALTWTPGGYSDPKYYEVYLDETLKEGQVSDLEYVFEDVAIGDHTAGVIAVYENGKSEMAKVMFTVQYDAIDVVSLTASVYPNPSPTGKFMLSVLGAGELNVYNLQGMFLMNKSLPAAGEYEIDLSHLSKGIYFMQVQNGDKVQTIKVIYN